MKNVKSESWGSGHIDEDCTVIMEVSNVLDELQLRYKLSLWFVSVNSAWNKRLIHEALLINCDIELAF